MEDLETLLQRKAVLILRDEELHAQFRAAPEGRRWPIELALDEVAQELDMINDDIADLEDAEEWDSAMHGRDERLADIGYYRMGLL
jgi:hypothetical protein